MCCIWHGCQAKDYERSLSLHTRGAELGCYLCRRSLGLHIYGNGYCGVEVDLKQALYWLEKANEQSGGEEEFDIVGIRTRLMTRRTSGEE